MFYHDSNRKHKFYIQCPNILRRSMSAGPEEFAAGLLNDEGCGRRDDDDDMMMTKT